MTTLHEDQYTFSIIFHSFLIRMRNVSGKICRKNQNTYFVFSKLFFLNRAVCELTRKNIAHCMLGT